MSPLAHFCVSAICAVAVMYCMIAARSAAFDENTLVTAGSACVQGHSTLQASRDFSTLLTWTAEMNSQKTVNAAATTRRKSRSRIASQVPDGGTQQEVDSIGRPGTKGCQSKPCSVFCCVSVCIDRAVFASIEDSDSDLDNHGEDSSSNTSADDHMTTKRSECCLHGAGVKEVRGQNHF